MPEQTVVIVVARIAVPVNATDTNQAKEQAIGIMSDRYPGLAWTVERVNTPWGT